MIIPNWHVRNFLLELLKMSKIKIGFVGLEKIGMLIIKDILKINIL
jgi:hypothetical protein